MVSTPWTCRMDGLDVLALRTPTLPPATTTNTSFVGRRDVWIVDPATPWSEPRGDLLRAVEALEREGRRARGIVLTHHHPDHVGAARWLRERLRVPILAHARTRALLDGSVPVDEGLEEGDVLIGSAAPDDRWEVLHTPGHASGHVVLWEPTRRGMVVGDMVAAEGTVLVEPPDGDMATYIAQLRRLAGLGPRWLVPAHGHVIEDAVATLEAYVQHRLMREGRVLGALAEGSADLRTLAERSYPELPEALLPLAERSCLAHLVKLEQEGRAARRDDAWHLTAQAEG